jgi:hypothetical protein
VRPGTGFLGQADGGDWQLRCPVEHVARHAEHKPAGAFAQGRAPAETLDDGLLVTELLMTCYLSAELGETLRFPVSGIEDYVPDVQRGQWSPQALVDQAKLHSIEKQPGPQG